MMMMKTVTEETAVEPRASSRSSRRVEHRNLWHEAWRPLQGSGGHYWNNGAEYVLFIVWTGDNTGGYCRSGPRRLSDLFSSSFSFSVFQRMSMGITHLRIVSR